MNQRQISVVVIGAGNRANKYLEYVTRNRQKVKLVGVVEPVDLRRERVAEEFNLEPSNCFTCYEQFFAAKIQADAVFICTPEDKHFEPCMMAIDAGYNVLLEKPIAQSLEECEQIRQAANRRGVVVAVCHILRYHPYFQKIKQIVDSGSLGQIISINHTAEINLDRMMHSYVRGIFSNEQSSNPLLVAKCCHDIDFLLWLCSSRCKRVSSFGSLSWFKEENAPSGSSARCVACKVESNCPYSAVDLYRNRKEWIANFNVPSGGRLEDVIEQELLSGRYGRCVFHCDNDVVDHQVVNLEMEDGVTMSIAVNAFTRDDCRRTHIKLTNGEIDGDERSLRVRHFRNGEDYVLDYSHLEGQPYHAGADLNIVDAFLQAISSCGEGFCSDIADAIESHVVCFNAERSRREGVTVDINWD